MLLTLVAPRSLIKMCTVVTTGTGAGAGIRIAIPYHSGIVPRRFLNNVVH